MTTATNKAENEMVVQEHCIDLPGESVQCWLGGGTDKLRVILRKHRDVIFDLNLGNGKSYSVESTESDFYNVCDKKLMFAARHASVAFRDGERLHLWISRGFRGSLVLKCDNIVLARVSPNEWDSHRTSENPKEKPAPIIISLGEHKFASKQSQASHANHTTLLALPQKTIPQARVTPEAIPHPAAATKLEENCAVICVVDGRVEGMPEHLVQYFKRGGDGSGFSDIDPNHVATRNWILGQLSGALAYGKDNWNWLKASIDGKTSEGFKLVKAKIHYVRGKIRFYFSGYSNSNFVFGRGGYGPGHERIMTIFSGAGETKSTFMAAAKGVGASFKGCALISFIFGSATAIAEWKDDAKKDGYDLAAALMITLIKAILVTVLTSAIVAIIVMGVMMWSGVAIPVLLVGVGALVISFGVNYLAEGGDKSIGAAVTGKANNTDGTASVIAPWLRNVGEKISENWSYLVSKMPNDYSEMQF
jgi:hypothetical protein